MHTTEDNTNAPNVPKENAENASDCNLTPAETALEEEHSDAPRNMSDNAQALPSKRNKFVDKGEKYIKRLRTMHRAVSIFMWISIAILLITTLVCGIRIYRTVSASDTVLMPMQ